MEREEVLRKGSRKIGKNIFSEGETAGMKRRIGRTALLALFGFLLFPSPGLGESPQKKDGPDQESYYSHGQMDLFKDKVSLILETEKNSAYLYEMIPLTIKMRVKNFSIKEIQYPKFPHEGFFKAEFDDPLRKEETINGLRQETVEFKTFLFGTQAGNFILGPAQLQCTVQADNAMGQPSHVPPGGRAREDFFGARETYPLTLNSEKLSLKILPLPGKGKPHDFNDAVGNFRFRLEVQPREVRVGEPITLKMVIEGKGNFNPITPPQMETKGGFKIYAPQAAQKGGAKIFEQVIIPQTEALKEIPRVRFSFYDPEKKNYRILTQGPVPLKVAMADPDNLKNAPKSGLGMSRGERELPGRDIMYITESPGRLAPKGTFLYKNRAFLLMQGIPLLLLMIIFGVHKRRERLNNDLIYAAQKRASKIIRKGLKGISRTLGEGKPDDFYNRLFKTLQTYLVDKFNLPPGEITRERIAWLMESRGEMETWKGKFENIFTQCDLARYAAAKFEKGEMEKIFEEFKDLIGHLEKKKWGT